jgi:MFS family permease
LLIPYLVAEGVLSPLIMPAMLPDMLDTTRPSYIAPADYKVDEHTTNIVTSFFTTSFNLGGIFGPLLGAYLIPSFGGWIHMTGFVEDQLGMGTVLSEATTPPPPSPTMVAESVGVGSRPQAQPQDDEQVLASSDGPQTSEMSMAELENAFGFRSVLATMALVFLAISSVLLMFECVVFNAAGKYQLVKTSEEDDNKNRDENKQGSEERVP